MARRRIRRRRLAGTRPVGTRIARLGAVVATFLLIGVAAVVVGYLAGSYLVATLRGEAPQGIRPPDPIGRIDNEGGGERADEPAGAPEAELVVMEASGITLYPVQAGSFAAQANAAQLAEDMRSSGFPTYIMGGDNFKVWIGIYDIREPGRLLAAKLQEHGHEAFVTEWQLAGGSGTLASSSPELAVTVKEAVETLPEHLLRLSAAWSAFQMGTDAEGLAAARQDIAFHQSRLAELEVPDDLGGFLGDLTRLYNQAAMVAASLEALAGGDLPSGEFQDIMGNHLVLTGEAAQFLAELPAVP